MAPTPAFVWFAAVSVVAIAGAAARERQAGISAAPHSAAITLPADITSLTAINQSSHVAAGLADGQVVVWNGRDRAPAVVLQAHAARVLAVGSTADGRELWSVAVDGSLALTRIAPGAQPTSRRLDFGAAPTRAAAFSNDGRMLVTGGEFGEIRVFDAASGALQRQLRGHRTELQCIALRPGSAVVASASAEADLRIWDAAAGREISSVDSDLSLFALAFSPRDGTLASGGVDRRLTLRDSTTFKAVGQLVLQAPRMVATLAWSRDGRFIALGDIDDESLSKGGIQVVDAASRAAIASLDTGQVPAGGVVFAGDAGMVVAVVGRDLRAWTVAAVK
jgi:WD40 repeat protein